MRAIDGDAAIFTTADARRGIGAVPRPRVADLATWREQQRRETARALADLASRRERLRHERQRHAAWGLTTARPWPDTPPPWRPAPRGD